MKRIDLDDLPPKLAALLASAEAGEAVLLVRNGVVVGRLTGGAAEPAPQSQEDPEQTSDERAKEIFEQFRSMMEDEF
jgi:antitoxin (DNA-binding transcriptional repressor) of toxin-antitoxin stability system